MNEKKSELPIYIGFAIAIIIVIFIGYYFWSGDSISTEPIITDSVASTTDSVATTTKTADSPAISNTEVINTANVADSIINKVENKNMNKVTIETNKGRIVIETYNNDAPKASQNFIDLANKGFYNSVIFHRIIKGFMIQGGDPTGTGRGGPGYTFEDELNPNSVSYKTGYKRGVVAMANSGPNTNGSQFFIMHSDYPLPNNYTIFGYVVEGMDVVDAIANTEVGAEDRPIENIVMNKVIAE